MASLANGLATSTFKIYGGGIQKHQVKIGEQVLAVVEQPFFNQVFGAAGRMGPILLIGDLFAKKTQSAAAR